MMVATHSGSGDVGVGAFFIARNYILCLGTPDVMGQCMVYFFAFARTMHSSLVDGLMTE